MSAGLFEKKEIVFHQLRAFRGILGITSRARLRYRVAGGPAAGALD